MDDLYDRLDLDPLNDTQVKILEGAKHCVLKWGQAKTSLNDIAKVAGVTRPTIYSYYKSKEEVIKRALLFSGCEFARKLMENMEQFDNDEDRFLESVIFAIEELPKEPYLSVIASSDLSDIVKDDALQNPKGILICIDIFKKIFLDQEVSDQDLYEIIEVTVRMALSLIMIESPIKRGRTELKTFLRKRLLPLIL